MEQEVQSIDLSLVISIISLIIASITFSWVCYREFFAKPKMTGMIRVSNINEGSEVIGPFINLQFVNLGPGLCHISSLVTKKRPPLWFLGNKICNKLNNHTKWNVVRQNEENKYSSKLPKRLDVGETLDLYIDYNKQAFINKNFTHVGVTDSFGRCHWVNRKQFKEVQRQFNKEIQIIS